MKILKHILLADFAVPNIYSMIKNNCLTTSNNNLITSIQRARSEAIKRQTTVTITSNNGTAWGNGWNITINEDTNGNGVLDTNEDFDGDGVLDAAALMQAVTLSCTATTITGSAATFNYDGEGFINAAGTFDICDDRTEEVGRQITINAVGRPNTNSNFLECT